jgi:phosphatidylethanolamine-binding protein (PEBP) family uncharacterized protein
MAGAMVSPPCDSFASQVMGDTSFKVTASGFESCMAIPAENTCDAKPFPQGTSPAISWTAGPSGTKSYALVLKDLAVIGRNDPSSPDYNKGFHYVMWDIPPTTMSLPAGMMGGYVSTDVTGALQWSNFNNYAYFGPCPNYDPTMPTNWNDTYAFTLYALPFDKFTVPAQVMGHSTVRVWDDAFKAAALAVTEYRGMSSAHSSGIPDGVLPPMPKPPCAEDGSTPADGCISPTMP